jgi:HEPN domain-containing protein
MHLHGKLQRRVLCVMNDDKRTAIDRWMSRASNDLRTAQTMLTVDPPTTDTICFHAQQCIEKSLKAFLTFADQHIERTHDLVRLVALCKQIDPTLSILSETAVKLTDYAVTSRYPDDWRDIPVAEAQEAVREAEKGMQFITQKLVDQLKGNNDDNNHDQQI